MEILVRKYTAKPRFKPHYNTATGRYYHTSREYVDDLKAKGLQLVKSLPSQHTPPPSHKPSAWSRTMANTIRNAKSVRNLGSRFYDELRKKGVNARPCP